MRANINWIPMALLDTSIIIPVYNRSKSIERLLERLSMLEDLERAEVVVADNNSTDDTAEVIKRNRFGLERLQVVEEKYVQNPDAARNRALEQSTGRFLAFTDSDCEPDVAWLRNGIEPLARGEADIVAGRIEFLMGDAPSVSERYDSITFLQHGTAVDQRATAFTANLFARREVLEHVGGCPVVPGWAGDTVFTRLAVDRGYRLVYEPSAVIRHKPRNFRQLKDKFWRIGHGKGASAFDAVFRRRSMAGEVSRQSLKVSGSAQAISNLNPITVARQLRAAGCDRSVLGTMRVWSLGAGMMTYCAVVLLFAFGRCAVRAPFDKAAR